MQKEGSYRAKRRRGKSSTSASDSSAQNNTNSEDHSESSITATSVFDKDSSNLIIIVKKPTSHQQHQQQDVQDTASLHVKSPSSQLPVAVDTAENQINDANTIPPGSTSNFGQCACIDEALPACWRLRHGIKYYDGDGVYISSASTGPHLIGRISQVHDRVDHDTEFMIISLFPRASEFDLNSSNQDNVNEDGAAREEEKGMF